MVRVRVRAPAPPAPLWAEVLVRRSAPRSVGSAEGNQTKARANLQHLPEGGVYPKPRVLSALLSTILLRKGRPSHSLFCALVSPTVTWLVAQPKGQITQGCPFWVKRCAGGTCAPTSLCPPAPCLGTLPSPSPASCGGPSHEPCGPTCSTSTCGSVRL